MVSGFGWEAVLVGAAAFEVDLFSVCDLVVVRVPGCSCDAVRDADDDGGAVRVFACG